MSYCRNGALTVAALILIAACDQTPDPATITVRKEPVVVYAAFKDAAHLRTLFAEYTDKTDVLVIVRGGDSDAIVDDVIENRISPPADVLVTRSVTDAWRAAEEGALRPISSDSLKTPAWSRDPDNLWAGFAFRTAIIVHGYGRIDGPLNYADLAESRFGGEVCLSSVTNPMNQAVIAMLIHERGVRPTESIVRGWIRNLTLPVFDSDDQVLDAIVAGHCKIGIVSSAATARSGLWVHIPSPTFADVDAIGIGRHARNPAGAAALVEWLMMSLPTAQFDEHERVTRHNVGLVAWYQDDVIKLAERARYP